MRKKYYEDSRDNAAFDRCTDVMTALIVKYGSSLRKRWNLEKFLTEIWIDIVFSEVAVRRFDSYFKLQTKYRKENKAA